jgi:hypothetical protein
LSNQLASPPRRCPALPPPFAKGGVPEGRGDGEATLTRHAQALYCYSRKEFHVYFRHGFINSVHCYRRDCSAFMAPAHAQDEDAQGEIPALGASIANRAPCKKQTLEPTRPCGNSQKGGCPRCLKPVRRPRKAGRARRAAARRTSSGISFDGPSRRKPGFSLLPLIEAPTRTWRPVAALLPGLQKQR